MDKTNKNLCMGCMKVKGTDDVCPYCGFDPKAVFDDNYILPGTNLDGRYIIGKLESFNGEGCVYIGYDSEKNKTVWIKEYFPNGIAIRDPQTMQVMPRQGYGAQYKSLLSDYVELANEIRKLGTSEFVVPVENMVAENNTIYVVYTYIEALTLEEYLVAAGGKLTPQEAVDLLIPVLNAVDNLHVAGIVHRGLSPYTILITKNKKTYIDGLCIAPARTGGSELKAELFSGYSAPEQYVSTGWQGAWTDVYALAAVFYRTVSGIVPPKSTRISGSGAVLDLKTLVPGINEHVSKAVEKAMQPSAQGRTQTVAGFLSDLIEEDGVPKTEVFGFGRIPPIIATDDYKGPSFDNSFESQGDAEMRPKSQMDDFMLDFDDDVEPPRNRKFDFEEPEARRPSNANTNTNRRSAYHQKDYVKERPYDDEYEQELEDEPVRRGTNKPKKKKNKWFLPILLMIIIAVMAAVLTAVILSQKLGLFKPNNTVSIPENVSMPEAQQPNQPSSQDPATSGGESSQEDNAKNEVPNFIGLELSKIEFNPKYTDLFNFEIKEEYSDKMEEGKVIEQKPETGAILPKGGTVVLTVSKGKQSIQLPELKDMEYEQALQELKRICEENEIVFDDLKVDKIDKVINGGKANYVLYTNPEAGKDFDPANDKLEIYVSQPPPVAPSSQSSKPPVVISIPDKNPDGTDASPNVPRPKG